MSDTELIVLVDKNGQPIGVAPKLASHHAQTPLHLAFSVYIFNTEGDVLVTQRARSKRVWPGVWTNSCCGHPAPGETMTAAIERRSAYELGMAITDVQCILPDYRYTTPAFKGIIENEICPVFMARTQEEPTQNTQEVAGYAWVSWDKFRADALADNNDTWSYWCKDQLKQMPTNPILAAN